MIILIDMEKNQKMERFVFGYHATLRFSEIQGHIKIK